MGKVLLKPLHLLQQEQHGVSGDTALLSSSSTILVLWLPHADNPTARSQKQVGAQDGDKEDIQMQPANNRVLALGWARLQEFKQVDMLVHNRQLAHAECHAMNSGDLVHLLQLALVPCQYVISDMYMCSGQASAAVYKPALVT